MLDDGAQCARGEDEAPARPEPSRTRARQEGGACPCAVALRPSPTSTPAVKEWAPPELREGA
eukprot:12955792-Alexandrium_andersonii.AAC.1